MTGLDWQSLVVEVEDRSAIFSETFPTLLGDALESPAGAFEAFDTTAALEVLATFAGAWGSLHRDQNGHRWQYRSVVTATREIAVLAFRAIPPIRTNAGLSLPTSIGLSRP